MPCLRHVRVLVVSPEAGVPLREAREGLAANSCSRGCECLCDLDVVGNLVRPVRLLNTKFCFAPEDMDE